MGSTLISIATIFSSDVLKPLYGDASKRLVTIVGRFTAIGALLVAMGCGHALLGNSDQAFQYIQEYTASLRPASL